MLGKIEWVTRGRIDRIDGRNADCSMVRMKGVGTEWIVSDHDIGTEGANLAHHFLAKVEIGHQLAVVQAQEDDIRDAESPAGFALFTFTQLGEILRANVGPGRP